MKVSDLAKMIREIVRGELERAVVNEIKKQLPGALSEMYVRKIVAEESSASRNRFTDLVFAEEDNTIPSPMKNDDEGIYQDDPLFKEKNEALAKNPFKNLYEGVTIPPERAPGPTVAPSLPNIDFEKMSMLAGVKRQTRQQAPSKEDDAKLERLKRYRESLEIPVGNGDWRK